MPTDNSTPNGGRIIVPQPPLAHKHNVTDLIGLDVGTIPVGSVPKYTSTGWTAAPIIPDGTPNAPTITSTSTSSYVTGQDPATATSVTVNLAAPTTNTDGSAFYGAQQYFVRWRYEDSSLSSTPSSWAVIPGLGAASSISFFNVRQKTTLSVQVAVIDIYSHQSAWSSTTAVTTFTPSNPQTPSAPTVTSKLGGINVVWDGLTAAGGAMDADLDRVDIYYRSGATFTSLSQATKWDSMYRAGWNLITNLAVDTTYYVALVAYNLAGGVSGISTVSSVTVQKLSSTETLSISSAQIASIDAGTITVGTLSANRIAANSISVDRLAAGTMSANVVLGGTFATSSSTSANRVVMSSSGIAAYGGTGASAGSVQTFLLDAATGNLALNGNGGPTLTMTGGTLNSSTINAATIRTSSSVTGSSTTAAGVVLDINGLRAYKANNASPTFSIDSTGAATFSGTVSGSQVNGATISGGSISGSDISTSSNGTGARVDIFGSAADKVNYVYWDTGDSGVSAGWVSSSKATPQVGGWNEYSLRIGAPTVRANGYGSSIGLYGWGSGSGTSQVNPYGPYRHIELNPLSDVNNVINVGGWSRSNVNGGAQSISNSEAYVGFMDADGYYMLMSTAKTLGAGGRETYLSSGWNGSTYIRSNGNDATGQVKVSSGAVALTGAVAITGTLSSSGRIVPSEHVVPNTDNASYLGLLSKRWLNIFSYGADVYGQLAANSILCPSFTTAAATFSGTLTSTGNMSTSGTFFSSGQMSTNGNMIVGGSLYGTGGLNIQPSVGAIGVAINSSNDFVPTTSVQVNCGTTAARWAAVVTRTFEADGISTQAHIYPNITYNALDPSVASYNLGQVGQRWGQLFSRYAVNVLSDGSLKTDIIGLSETNLGMAFIRKLRPVSYKWIHEGEYPVDESGNLIFDDPLNPNTPKYVARSGIRPHTGFIAQEVKQAFTDAGVEDWAGWTKDDVNDPNSLQALRYEEFISPLVAAVQNIDARLAALEGGTP
jgi:hypothetical protein